MGGWRLAVGVFLGCIIAARSNKVIVRTAELCVGNPAVFRDRDVVFWVAQELGNSRTV